MAWAPYLRFGRPSLTIQPVEVALEQMDIRMLIAIRKPILD